MGNYPLFPILTEAQMRARLAPPSARVRMVLDTDTANEIDDQFALVYAMLSPARLDVEAMYAAPFDNEKSNGPADGMEQSYREIVRLLAQLEVAPEGFVYRGATRYLPGVDAPVESEAVRDLITRAKAGPAPLYVVAIGAITNIASALLLAPEIVERIVVVWLGGHASHWPHNREFNLQQDPLSARVLFDAGVPLIRVPCYPVASHMLTTAPELERYVQGKSAIGDDLVALFKAYHDDHYAWAKEIWDLAAVAYLVEPSWVTSALAPSPILNDDLTWTHDAARRLVREVQWVNRNAIFRDLFDKLASQ
ncbi:MAG: nucleoside hydrolase [Chloroflexi bacterium]|jgi:inosine-uridine nucleoside N-ribohydrolase|nr:nucleoside hydrolase [Chloroflexota bacterium]